MGTRQQSARTGRKLGRYRIERELGRGGMGVVYLAIDENLGRRVALKTTSIASIGSSEQARSQRQARFIREVKALAQVNHENVVHVFDTGEADDTEMGWLLFYTMQFVDGITLAQLVHRLGALDPGGAAAVCMQVAAGLGAAHKTGIVHRDVKPANIFIDKAGRALIGDFGICKLEGSTQITRRDQLVGTPNYLAPEQILGEEITPATDVFALGALFFVIATNRPLRDKVDPASLLKEAQTNDPKKKMLALRQVPEGLRKVVAKALERDPKKRFPDCGQFADALAEHATRIPAFEAPTSDNMTRPQAAAMDTDTSPFAPLPRTGPEVPSGEFLEGETPAPAPFEFAGSGAAGVEEAALALLKDAGISDKKKQKAAAQLAKAKARRLEEERARAEPSGPTNAATSSPSLPVARTESTVMFNLREAESQRAAESGPGAAAEPDLDDEKEAPLLEPKGSSSGELPVARAESTVMFNLRQMEEQHKGSAGAPPPPSPTAPPPAAPPPGAEAPFEASAPPGPTPAAPAVANPALAEPTSLLDDARPEPTEEPTAEQPVEQPPVQRVDAVAVAKASGPRRPLPPAAWAGAMAIGGILLGVVVLLLVKGLAGGGEAETPPPTGEPVEAVPEIVGKAHPACAGEAERKGDIRTAAKLVAVAQQLVMSDKQDQAFENVKRAVRLDPQNVEAHSLLARQLADRNQLEEAIAAYECVLYVDPASLEADSARTALEGFQRFQD